MSSLPPTVVEGSGALPYPTVCNRHARARVYLQGAHVASYRPVGHGEVLWESVRSWYAPGKPIRGGIPVCFPWFGPHPERGDFVTVGSPLKLSDSPVDVTSSPLLGEHNEEVYVGELGLGDEELRLLKSNGVI